MNGAQQKNENLPKYEFHFEVMYSEPCQTSNMERFAKVLNPLMTEAVII